MRKSLAISLALHVSVLLWVFGSVPWAREIRAPQPPPIPVEIVTPSKASKVKSGRRKAKTDVTASIKSTETKPARASKPKARKRPTKTARSAPPKRKRKTAKVAPKKKTAKPAKPRKPKRPAKARPPVKPKPKARAEKKTNTSRSKRVATDSRQNFNADRIAALLNKVPDAGSRAASPPRPDAEATEPPRGFAEGRDQTLSRSEIDALRARISQCWNPPVGGMGADRIRVKLRLRLNADGSLTRAPQVVNREASPFFQAAADSAVRAVLQCQPYSMPAEKYAVWRDMMLNFDPREMLGG